MPYLYIHIYIVYLRIFYVPIIAQPNGKWPGPRLLHIQDSWHPSLCGSCVGLLLGRSDFDCSDYLQPAGFGPLLDLACLLTVQMAHFQERPSGGAAKP